MVSGDFLHLVFYLETRGTEPFLLPFHHLLGKGRSVHDSSFILSFTVKTLAVLL